MQLKKRRYNDIRGTLALATCTLLQGTAHAAADIDHWQVDSALLFYSEKDRIDVIEPAVFASRQLDENESLTLRGVFDTMSGATPNGAVPSATPQTFSSPSGNPYTVPANQTPMMDFNDQRGSIGFDWDKETSRLGKRTFSGDLSAEGDYSSLSGSLTYAFDSENRMTTLAIGGGLSYDKVNPDGGKPDELSLTSSNTVTDVNRSVVTMARSSGSFSSFDDDDEDGEGGEGGEGGDFSLFQGEQKVTANLLFGVTQVLSRRALVQLNYTHSQSSGYLNDPYKVVSLVDSAGLPVDAVFEKRPDSRSGNALFAKLVFHLPEDVVHLSYRYYWDDWGIKSQTADLSYRMELWSGSYLQPHLRYYTQTKADFYRSALLNTSPLPDYASADYRLAEMKSTTAGLKLGFPVDDQAELSLRLEIMKQRGDNHPSDAIGALQQVDLYPGLDATIFQISYTTKF
jgi:hypothetical protein